MTYVLNCIKNENVTSWWSPMMIWHRRWKMCPYEFCWHKRSKRYSYKSYWFSDRFRGWPINSILHHYQICRMIIIEKSGNLWSLLKDSYLEDRIKRQKKRYIRYIRMRSYKLQKNIRWHVMIFSDGRFLFDIVF